MKSFKKLPPHWAFLLCLLMTVGVSFLVFFTAKIENNRRLEHAANTYVGMLERRMTTYSNSLVSTKSLFQIKPDLTGTEFQQFVDGMELAKNFPGIQSMGYIERLSLDETRHKLKQIGPTIETIGIPPNSSAVSLIRYVVNLQETNEYALGLDMGGSELRRIAMDQARDSGMVVVSRRVPTPSFSKDLNGNSFLIFAPLYRTSSAPPTVQARRDHLKGFVYAHFHLGSFFGRLTTDSLIKTAGLHVEVYEGNEAQSEFLMFEGGSSGQAAVLKTLVPYTFGGHSWLIRMSAPSTFLVPYLNWGPYVVFIIGFLVSLLIAFALKNSQDARREADSANQAKSIFLANISHEVRTPLGVMIGFADLALRQLNPLDKDASLKSILRNGKELTRIIDDVLDVSKIEANKLKIEMHAFSLHQMLTSVSDIWRPVIESRGVEYRLVKSASLPLDVFADEVRIKQIINNLLSNAAKFTSDGTVEFAISEESGHLRFTVRDTGLGISPSSQEKLFKPFSQGDSSITRQFGGCGLGLALSRKIATAMNGTLEIVVSELGKGTLFELRVPYKPAAVVQEVVAPEKVSESLEGKKILLVEDSKENRTLITLMLQRVGATISTADDGEEGVRRALAQKYDLILMDIQMPNKDGYSAFQDLKARNLKTPIIALTAHALAEERDKALKMGFAGFLTKPVDYESLISLALKFMRSRSFDANEEVTILV